MTTVIMIAVGGTQRIKIVSVCKFALLTISRNFNTTLKVKNEKVFWKYIAGEHTLAKPYRFVS